MLIFTVLFKKTNLSGKSGRLQNARFNTARDVILQTTSKSSGVSLTKDKSNKFRLVISGIL